MAGSTVADCRAAFVRCATDELAKYGIPVGYGDPGGEGRREHVWLGEAVDGDVETRAIAALPRKRVEDYSFDVTIEIIGLATPQATETKAVTVMAEMETMLAADPTVDGVTNLQWLYVNGWTIDTDQTSDGPRTRINLTLSARGRID